VGKYNTTRIEVVEGVREDEELLLYAEVEMASDTKLKKNPLRKEAEKTKKREPKKK
jgi:hypothetical protein